MLARSSSSQQCAHSHSPCRPRRLHPRHCQKSAHACGVHYRAKGCSSSTSVVESTPRVMLYRRRDVVASMMIGTGAMASSSSQSALAATANEDGAVAELEPQPQRRVRYEEFKLNVDGRSIVPLSVWIPDQPTNVPPPSSLSYRHSISVAKIARLILRTDANIPTWLDRSNVLLPASDGVFTVGNDAPLGRQNAAVLLSHGFLGSRFDLVDYAEGLARRGIVAVAPDFRESLSNPAGVDVPRDAVVSATFEFLNQRCEIASERIGLAGHSAGAGTTLLTPGQRPRVALAGFRGNCSQDVLSSPLLVIASDNDGVISMQPTPPDARFPFEGVLAAVESLPVSASQYGEADLDALVASADLPSPAFVRLTTANHLSFLSDRTNDALIDVVGNLLPVARALDIRALDFDKYYDARDSQATLRTLAPLVTRFFAQHLL